MSRPRHFSHREIDRLFAGYDPDSARLASVVPLVRALRAAASAAPSDHTALRFARQAALAVQPTPNTEAAVRPRSAVSAARRRSYARLAGAVATLVIMLSASVGVAYAADGSAPGDPLHGLDLAMESMGIGDGGLSERLAEAGSLIKDGRVGQGLTAAAGAIAVQAGPSDGYARQAAEALLAAAESVARSGDAASASVRAQVAEKLRFLATTDLAGNEFGQAVSDLARGIDPQDADLDSDTSTTKHAPPANKGGRSDDESKGNNKNQ